MATNSVSLQVGHSGQAAGAQSGFQNHEGNGSMGQFDQPGGGDGQFGHPNYHPQDCHDPDCFECYGPGERYPSHNFH